MYIHVEQIYTIISMQIYNIRFSIDTYQLSNELLYTNVQLFSSTTVLTIIIYISIMFMLKIFIMKIYIYLRYKIKNIIDVLDPYALDIIRKIETKEYEYVDKKLKGNDKV